MRKNYIALGLLFLLCFFVISVAVTPTQGAYIRSGITGHSWLITTSQSTEITVSQAELLAIGDLYDFQKGLHSTMSRSEGSLVNINSVIRNDNTVQYTIEAAALIRYKIGTGSWVEHSRWTASGVINAHESISGSTTPTDLTRLGFWDTGNQIHLSMYVKAYPTTDPSDYTEKAWSLWLQISDTGSTPADDTNGDDTPSNGTNGDSTTDEHTDHSYDGLLAVLDPLTPVFGSRLGVVVVMLIGIFIVIAVLSIIMTDKEKW